jgi:Ras-related protein Rab-7A
MVENFALSPTNNQRQAGGAPRKHFVKLVVIGNSAVGKTSLIQQFEHSRFSEHFKPTIGADFSNKEIQIDEQVVIL